MVEAARLRIGDRCAALGADELRAPAGLGFGTEALRCQALGVPALDDADGVARCTLAEAACATDRMVALETPVPSRRVIVEASA